MSLSALHIFLATRFLGTLLKCCQTWWTGAIARFSDGLSSGLWLGRSSVQASSVALTKCKGCCTLTTGTSSLNSIVDLNLSRIAPFGSIFFDFNRDQVPGPCWWNASMQHNATITVLLWMILIISRSIEILTNVELCHKVNNLNKGSTHCVVKLQRAIFKTKVSREEEEEGKNFFFLYIYLSQASELQCYTTKSKKTVKTGSKYRNKFI